MLPRAERLRLEKDIEKVIKRGRAVFGQNLVMKYLANDLPYCRATVIVGAKVSKKATIRNKLKRRLRTLLKELVYPKKSGLDLIIITKPGSQFETFAALRDCVAGLVNRIK
jgi:ribonuclease P protein component